MTKKGKLYKWPPVTIFSLKLPEKLNFYRPSAKASFDFLDKIKLLCIHTVMTKNLKKIKLFNL